MGEKARNPFRIAQQDPAVASVESEQILDDQSLPPSERVAKMVDSSDLFVFMKGNGPVLLIPMPFRAYPGRSEYAWRPLAG